MAFLRITAMVLFLGLVALASAKPIMVSFGTKQGPIEPPEKSLPLAPRALVPRSPAPVSEETEDVPNPSTYRPVLPHQYRTKLYSLKPSPSLILGTPIDQRYTPALNKFDLYTKQDRSLGVDYTGPHVFERQEYELLEAKKLKTTLQPSTRYVKPHYFQQPPQDQKYVPQIGVVYSAGVRYYVPQIGYYQQDEQENSVYDHDDQKHFYREKQQ